MMISDEQVRLALEYLREEPGKKAEARAPEHVHDNAESDLFERVRKELSGEPEIRADKVSEARHALEHEGISSNDVASMIVGRMISDSLR